MKDAVGNLWLRHGTSRWLTSRRQRRRWVVGTYVGWLVIAAVTRLLDVTDPSWPRTLFLLLLANASAGLLWLGSDTYISSPTFGDPEFDERMAQIKNQAFRRAYQVLSLAVPAAGAATFTAVTSQPGAPGMADSFVIWGGLLLLAGLLPTTIVAWREPDLVQPEAAAHAHPEESARRRTSSTARWRR
jgi:hypothetical protein